MSALRANEWNAEFSQMFNKANPGFTGYVIRHPMKPGTMPKVNLGATKSPYNFKKAKARRKMQAKSRKINRR